MVTIPVSTLQADHTLEEDASARRSPRLQLWGASLVRFVTKTIAQAANRHDETRLPKSLKKFSREVL
jgi:hypothetical protein